MIYSHKRHGLAATLVLLLMAQPVPAMNFHVAGFGTASVSCFTSDDAQFVINDQPEGPGRNRRCDGGTDSVLGLQLDLEVLDKLEIGVQVVADRNADRDYLPGVMVAQLRWHPTENLTLRLGRMPTPVFLYSESRQVRYAMPWVRPPIEVYGLAPTFSNDGLEFIYRHQWQGLNLEWHGGGTYLEFNSPIANTKDTTPVSTYGGFLNLTAEYKTTTVKLGYLYNRLSYSLPDIGLLFNALQTYLPQGRQLVRDLALDDSPLHLFSLGFRHEENDWLLLGELSYRTIQGFFRDQYGAYLTVGKRFEAWMPYATVARRWTSGPNQDSRAGFLQPQVAALLTGTRFDSTSLSLGLARDLNENIKLKLQADWIQPDGNSWGLYTNHGPNYSYQKADSDWLLSLSLDFVF